MDEPLGAQLADRLIAAYDEMIDEDGVDALATYEQVAPALVDLIRHIVVEQTHRGTAEKYNARDEAKVVASAIAKRIDEDPTLFEFSVSAIE